MILDYSRRCFIAIVFLMITAVNLQMPVQLYQLPSPGFGVPPAPVPVPMPPPDLPSSPFQFQITVPMPVPFQMPVMKKNTEHSMDIALPMSVPFPIQFAVPAYPPPQFCQKRPKPNNCPVCPPCLCNPCTPAFFSYCSPCHKKCRCRNKDDTPVPMPPIPAPVPAFAMPVASPAIPLPLGLPVHARQNLPRHESDDSYETMDYSSSSSSERSSETRWRRNKIRRRRRPLYRRSQDYVEEKDSELVKPVLSYISRDGDVKLEKPLSDDEAAELIDENNIYRRVYVTAGENQENKSRLQVVSKITKKSSDEYSSNHRRRQVVLKPGSLQNMLSEGKKELVFRPPVDKKISNLSVSFQIV